MINEYNTISYKDKLELQYNSKIKELLSNMPSFCKDYELYIRNKNSLKTRVEYLMDIYNFFRYLVSKNPLFDEPIDITLESLEKLNGFDFDDYLAWLSNYKFDEFDVKEKYKTNINASKKRKMMAIKSLFHFLYVREYISCNPTEKAIIPTVHRKKRKNITILEDNECDRFLRIIEEEYKKAIKAISLKPNGQVSKRNRQRPYYIIRDRAIVYLILGTGLRVSELCAIDCANISHELRYINVIRKGDGDDDNTSDKVYLSDEVYDVLIDYIDNAREYLEPDFNNYDALFISSKNQRMTPRAVELMVKKYADTALGTGNNIHPHTLRATFGTRYYKMSGGDISATSTAMNHSGIEITAQYYVQEDKNAKQAVQNLKINPS